MPHKTLLLAIFLTATAAAHAQWPAIDSLLSQVERNNTALQALAARLDAQTAALQAESNLSDPQIEYTYQFGRHAEPNESELNVTQAFDLPQRYARQADYGRAQAHAWQLEAQTQRRDILLNAQLTALQLCCIEEQLPWHQQRLQAADSLTRILTQRLNAGDASALDLAQAQTQRLAAATALAEANAQRLTLVAQLNAMGADIAVGDCWDIAVGAGFYPAQSVARPKTIAVTQSPRTIAVGGCLDILTAQAQVTAAQANIPLARSGSLPQLQVGYRRSGLEGTEIHGFTLGATLPLFSNRHRTRQARAQLLDAQLSLRDTEQQVVAEQQALQAQANALEPIVQRADTNALLHHLDLLRKALDTGYLAPTDYFYQAQAIHDAALQAIATRYQYHAILARLHKNEL